MRARLLTVVCLAAVLPATAEAQQGGVTEGKVTFEAICTICHTTTPPPKLAPPLAMVADHYRESYSTEAEGVAAIARFILAPDAARSALPAHAVERFGLMPRLALTEAQATAVARYVWNLGSKPPKP